MWNAATAFSIAFFLSLFPNEKSPAGNNSLFSKYFFTFWSAPDYHVDGFLSLGSSYIYKFLFKR